MGRPVKIADGLYEQLRTTAERERIDIQEALRRRMEVATTKISELDKDRTKLSGELKSQMEKLKRVQAYNTEQESALASSRERMAEKDERLGKLAEERDEALAWAVEWWVRAQDYSASADNNLKLVQRTQVNLNSVCLVLEIVVMFAVAFFLYRKLQNEKADEAASFEEPLDQSEQPWWT